MINRSWSECESGGHKFLIWSSLTPEAVWAWSLSEMKKRCCSPSVSGFSTNRGRLSHLSRGGSYRKPTHICACNLHVMYMWANKINTFFLTEIQTAGQYRCFHGYTQSSRQHKWWKNNFKAAPQQQQQTNTKTCGFSLLWQHANMTYSRKWR